MKPIDGLPDTRGPLSRSVSPQAISEANKEVEKAKAAAGGKHGPYTKYSATHRADIGKYACQHSAAAVARHFMKRLEKPVSESTVKSIQKGYKEELRLDNGEELKDFPAKKHGRKLLLGEDLDEKVQMYIKKVREGEGAISARIVMAAARGILLKCNHADFGGMRWTI
jgi:hypothetical protein